MKLWLLLVLPLFACVKAQDEARPLAKKISPPVDWVSVTREKQISATEDLRLLEMPMPMAPSVRETCLIYRNHEFKTAQLVCPGSAPDTPPFGQGPEKD